MTIKISQLATLTSIDNNTLIPVVDTVATFATKKITGQTIKDYLVPIITSANLFINSSFAPNVSGVYNLGTVSSTFNDLYLAGTFSTSGQMYNTSGATSTSVSSGAIIITAGGGLGVSGSIHAGNITSTNVTGTLLTAAQPNITSIGTLTGLTVGGSGIAGTLTTAAQTNITSVGSLLNLIVSGTIRSGGQLFANAGTSSTSTATGALTVLGGVGIQGNLNINSLNNAGAINNGGTSGVGNIGASGSIFNTVFATSISGTLLTASQPNITTVGSLAGLTVASGGLTVTAGGLTVAAGNVIVGTTPTAYNNVRILHTTVSTSTTTGALTLGGGIGCQGNIYASGLISINSANNATAIINAGTNGVGNVGASGATFNTVFAKATTAQYADLAENYLADNNYQPGTVLEFGGEFEVTVASDNSPRVAGVVSHNPAYLMNTQLEGNTVVSVALQGRVPCKVEGAVFKGDMMVSAGNGYARKASITPAMGTVIGKSLENFSGGVGTIEVVVGRI